MLVRGELEGRDDKHLDAISKSSGYICHKAAESYVMIRMIGDRILKSSNKDAVLERRVSCHAYKRYSQ